MSTTDNQNIKPNEAAQVDFDELAALFGQASQDLEEAEKVVLSNDLEGFAHCFPDWDLHPPLKR